eukprot:7905043-Pyramimonas_sp.AAC.1
MGAAPRGKRTLRGKTSVYIQLEHVLAQVPSSDKTSLRRRGDRLGHWLEDAIHDGTKGLYVSVSRSKNTAS